MAGTAFRRQEALRIAPVELALHLSGRRSAAHVQLGGPPETVAAFRAWLERS